MSRSVSIVETFDPYDLIAFISTQNAKDHLHITTDDDDEFIEGAISTAFEFAQTELDLAILPQTLLLTLDDFPGCEVVRPDKITLDRAYNLIELDEDSDPATVVTYLDTEGDEQTLETTVYKVNLDAHPGCLLLKADQVWPATASEAAAVTIQYRAGWGPADVPKPLRNAILMVIGDLYNNRENSIQQPGIQQIQVPIGWERLTRTWNLKPL